MLVLNAQNIDPTRTTLLRRRLMTELRRRLNGLKHNQTFNRSVIDSTVAGHSSGWRQYVHIAFDTGVRRSFSEARAGLLASGGKLEGAQQEFLRLMTGMANAQVGDLNERFHDELLNLSSDLATRIKRTINDTQQRTSSQRLLRQAVNAEIDKALSRAELIVQTEVTRWHADGQLAAFEKLGVQRVGVLAEWTNPNRGKSPAGNPSPCRLCKPLVGITLTLKEAKGLIPRHPRCMCSFSLVGVRTEAQVRQKREIERAIKRSVKAEGNRTGWKGANRKIAPRR